MLDVVDHGSERCLPKVPRYLVAMSFLGQTPRGMEMGTVGRHDSIDSIDSKFSKNGSRALQI